LRELSQAHKAVELSKFVEEEITLLRSLWKTPKPDMPLTWVVERSVEKIRMEVANVLKDIVVRDTNLRLHLTFLKGFFLLGFGHFWHNFIDECSRILDAAPTAYAENELKAPWARAIQHEELKQFASCFDLRVTTKGFDFQGFTEAAQSLTLIGSVRIEEQLILGSSGSAMVWANVRQNVVHIAKHVLRFQMGERGGGVKFAILIQDKIHPQELHQTDCSNSLNWPQALGEALGLEVSVCHLNDQRDEITLALYLTTASVPLWKLKSVSMDVRRWNNDYELSITCKDDILRASLNEVHLETKLVLSDYLSVELGCGFLGLAVLPLADTMDRSPTRCSLCVKSWTHAASDSFTHRMHEIDGWQNALGLCFDVPWPASLVVTEDALQKYNQLFRLLFAFRRTHITLQRGWCDFKTEGPGTDWTMIIRSEMLFFVSQILQYFQQDVIEGLHNQLLETVEKTRDFEEIGPAHEDFLHQVMCDCFIFVPEVNTALLETAKTAILFAKLSQKVEPSTSPPTIVHKLRSNFYQTVKKVLRLLSTIDNDSPSLERLLLRLDYNKFFE